MRKLEKLFVLCCLVLSGFACDSQDRSQGTATVKEPCTPAIYYGCTANCDPGVKAWKKCNDDGASYGVCLCANPTPTSTPDASVPEPAFDAASQTVVPAGTPDASIIQITVNINFLPSPDSGATTEPSLPPPPVKKTCQNGSTFVPDASIRSCGFVAGACRPGAQTCNDGAWSECVGGILPTQEICDGADNDCDGAIDDGLICKCDPVKGPTRPCGGHDNVGACKAGTQSCISVGSGFEWATSCQGEVLPKPETCNLVDDDCDGVVDNGFNTGAACQGVGECGRGVIECNLQTNVAQCSTKPNGSNYRPMSEVCDGKDNDCDGLVDEDFYVGAPCISPGACSAFPGVYECSGLYAFICSTGPKGSHSKAIAEICSDLVDNNCDGVVNEGCDCKDGDEQQCGPKKAEGVDGSVGQLGECRNATIVCKNGKWPTTCPGAVYPTPEICDGKDNDCDGTVDNGFDIGTVCQGIGECGAGTIECTADHKGTICSTLKGGTQYHPTPEICDGKDNDCDGLTDEDYFIGAPCTGLGICGTGKFECASLSTARCSTMPGASQDQSKPEVCDATMKDENCNGSVNEGCACTPGSPDIVCGTSNVGECHYGKQTCLPSGAYGTCVGAINPSPELCDGKDNDCDGTADNGFSKQTDKNNCGFCGNVCSFANASALCQAGVCVLGACNANYFNFNGFAADGCETACVVTRGGVEYCDLIDNNCDGIVDNATVAVQTDPMNCGTCGHVCALPNVVDHGCLAGACTIVHCLPGYIDTNGLAADGCETRVALPDGSVGG